jgi:K+/H+ antiporter YhaU regulatory subunit KhtT
VQKTCIKKLKNYTRAKNMYNCCIATKVPKRNLTNQKGKIMFDFTKQTKQFEELAKRIQEVNEFWYNIVKDSFNTKTK